MKTYKFNEITLMQFIALTFGLQVSVGLLSLPRVLADQAGTDGWMAIIAGWLLSVASGLIIVQVMSKHPDGALPDLLTRYFGKWIGKAGAVLFAFYFFYYGYTGLVRTILYTKLWLLPQTPVSITMLLLLLPTYAIGRNGVRVLGRYAELMLFISFWIPIVYLIPLKDAHWLHLSPLLKEGWKPVLSAAHDVILSFTGIGAVFMFYPFLRNKRKASAGIVISNTLTMLVFVFVTFVCFLYFSPDEIREFNEPVVNVLKTIEFKFVERIEVLFIAFHLFIFSLAWIPAMYIGVFCTSWLIGKEDHRGHLRLLWLLLAASSFFYVPTFTQNDRMESNLTKAGVGFEFVFPICLLVYIWIYERYRGRKNT